MDIVRIFSPLSRGQRHNLNRAVRLLINFYEIKGFNRDYLNTLRKAIPKDKTGVDLRVPSEQKISDSLSHLNSACFKYQVLYNLLLDSGLRLVEAVKLIKSFNPTELEHLEGFYRVALGEFRGSKQAYYGYFTESTFKLISDLDNSVDLTARNASHYYHKYGYIAPKYLRKFAFDNMIALEIPESVADFIQGRVPHRVGAKHYMALRRQADRYYQRYAECIGRIRQASL